MRTGTGCDLETGVVLSCREQMGADKSAPVRWWKSSKLPCISATGKDVVGFDLRCLFYEGLLRVAEQHVVGQKWLIHTMLVHSVPCRRPSLPVVRDCPLHASGNADASNTATI